MVVAWICAISWHGGPVQAAGTIRERPPIKAGRPEPSPHLETACEIHHIYEDLNESSSARPGRSQQLEIPPSLNSKQAACFFSPAGFPSNVGFLPGFQRPQGFYRPSFFSVDTRISQIRLCFCRRKDFSNPPDFL